MDYNKCQSIRICYQICALNGMRSELQHHGLAHIIKIPFNTEEKKMRGSIKCCQKGSNIDVFLVVEGRGIRTNNTISGPPSTRQRNAISMAFRRRADNGPKMNAGSVAL